MKKLILLVVAFSGLAVSAQTVSKKVALTKGDQLEQVSKVTMNLTQEMMGQTMEIVMNSTSQSLVVVKDASNGSFEVASTLKSVLMNMNAMGQEMNFDSNKKEDLEGEMGAPYRDMLNKPSDFVLDKHGVVTQVKNKPAVKDDGNMMGSMIGGAMNEEKEGASFSSIANIPAKGVKVGDSWSDSANADGARTFTTYTLKEVKGNEGVVSVKGDLSMNKEMEQQGMTMVMDMKGSSTGEYLFDVVTGIIKSKKITTKASGNIDVMGQSVPMVMESTVESTVSKK